MRNGLAIAIQRSRFGGPRGFLPILLVGTVMLCAPGTGAAGPEAPTFQEQGRSSEPSAEQDPVLRAARRKVLTMLLDQLQQQTRAAEAAVQERNARANAESVLADVQALQERTRTVQQELDNLTRVGPGSAPAPRSFAPAEPGPVNPVPPAGPAQELRRLDERIQQLTRRREDLARSIRQAEAQLQQLLPTQETARRGKRAELAGLQTQLHNLDEQLTVLQQERLRADYAVTLQLHAEQERAKEEANQTAQTSRQVADLSAQLKQLQEQAQRNQQQLEQMQDRTGPQARALEKSLEGVNRQIQGIQDQLRQMERERAVDKLQTANRQRQALETYVQQLGQSQEDLKQSIEATRQDLRTLQEQMQQQTRAAGSESFRQAAQQSLEQLRAESLRQQEELRNQIRVLDERLRVATAHAGTGTEAFRKELDSLRADVQRMGQTIGRLERERLDTQASIQSQVQQLERQVADLRKDVALVQGTLNMMLSQMGRSTVGSAGCFWGW